MLAVARAAQGQGAGKALVRACIDEAREDGKAALVLHTTPWMTTAHRLYEGSGFYRDPERDWQVMPELLLARLPPRSRDLTVGSQAGSTAPIVSTWAPPLKSPVTGRSIRLP